MPPGNTPSDRSEFALESRYMIDSSESASQALIAALSEFPGIELEEWGPLHEWVDLDAYDNFLDSIGEHACPWLCFTIREYQVFVVPDEFVMIRHMSGS